MAISIDDIVEKHKDDLPMLKYYLGRYEAELERYTQARASITVKDIFVSDKVAPYVSDQTKLTVLGLILGSIDNKLISLKNIIKSLSKYIKDKEEYGR